ncbi:MAG: DNA repair protein RecO [Polyangiales bacterium]
MPRTELTDALVLRALDYGESDRIVTLLTERFGKVSVLARSARKSRRRFGGVLEPYVVFGARVSFGAGELGHLHEVELRRSFPRIVTSLDKIALGGSALSLVRAAVPVREPDARVFANVVEFFEALDGAEGPVDGLRLAFTVRVLSLVGFEPSFDMCARTGRRAPSSQAAYFDAELRSIVTAEAGGGPWLLSGAVREWLRVAVGAGWASAFEGDVPASELRAAEDAMRAFVELRIGPKAIQEDLVVRVRELGAR